MVDPRLAISKRQILFAGCFIEDLLLVPVTRGPVKTATEFEIR
jgi:hypothetical protein